MCCSRFDESKLHCNTAFRAKQLREVEGISFLSDKQNEALRLVSEPRPTVSNCQEGCRALDRDVGRLREFFVSGRISPALGCANHVKTRCQLLMMGFHPSGPGRRNWGTGREGRAE